MNYQTYTPEENLQAFVKCFWTLEAPEETLPAKQRIVPDGCMEMIFHLGDLYKQYTDETHSIIQPRCFVFGQITAPLDIEPTGVTGIFAVRFHPEGFIPFAAIPVASMENRAVPLEELFGHDGLLLEQQMLGAANHQERINLVTRFFSELLLSHESVDRTVKSCVEVILQLNGQLSVGELSAQVNTNRRQLERKFSSAIGLSPKQLSKIIRLQAALKMLANNQFTSLSALAYENDYYDQAHFIRDFKEFTGMSPKLFYADNLKMSSLFIE